MRLARRPFMLGAAAALAVPRLAAAAPSRVRMIELYEGDGRFSPLAGELKGSRIAMQGFMAPHLKVDADFFILSSSPVETCPFCATEEDWQDTIVFVRMRRKQEATPPGTLILVEGRLEIGAETDAGTGFVSMVRLTDAEYRRSGR